MKRTMIDSRREMSGQVRAGCKNPKSVRWDDAAKDGVKRREDAKKEVFRTNSEKKTMYGR